MNNAIFGHHPDAEIDFEIEVKELETVLSDWSVGLCEAGELPTRLAKVLDFQTCNTAKLTAKEHLREHCRKLEVRLGEARYIGAPVLLPEMVRRILQEQSNG